MEDEAGYGSFDVVVFVFGIGHGEDELTYAIFNKLQLKKHDTTQMY